MTQVAVLLHMGNFSLWERYPKIFSQFEESNIDYDLYINATDLIKDDEIAQIQQAYPKCLIIRYKNSGRDIGGYLHLLQHIKDKDYEYVLYLHTKTLDWWFHELINPICSTADSIKRSLESFKDPKVGMVGARNWLLTRSGENLCLESPRHEEDWVYYLCSDLKLDYFAKFKHIHFIGGTIFWIRFSIIKDFIRDYNINFDREFERFNVHFFIPHAWERLFGMLVEYYGYRIEGL